MDSTEQSMTQSIRRHDIDWLRVILFGLLVLSTLRLEFIGQRMEITSIQTSPMTLKLIQPSMRSEIPTQENRLTL